MKLNLTARRRRASLRRKTSVRARTTWFLYGSIAGAILGLLVVFINFTSTLMNSSRIKGQSYGERASRGPASERTDWDAIVTSVKTVALMQLTSGDELGAFETITVIPNNPDSHHRDTILKEMLDHVISRPDRVASEAQRFKKKKGEAGAVPDTPLDPELAKNKMQMAEKIVMQMQSSSFKINAWLDLARTGYGDGRKQYFDQAVQEARGVRIEANSESTGSDLRIRETADEKNAWEGIGGWLALLWPIGLAFFGAILIPILKAITDSLPHEPEALPELVPEPPADGEAALEAKLEGVLAALQAQGRRASQ
jgi:hypothetical protein